MRKTIAILLSSLFLFVRGNADTFDLPLNREYNVEDIRCLVNECSKTNDTLCLASAHAWLGAFYNYNPGNKNLETSIRHYTTAVDLYQKIGFEERSRALKMELGDQMITAGYHQDALDLFRESLAYYRSVDSTRLIPHHLSQMSRIYIGLKDTATYLNLLYQSTRLAETHGDSFLLGINYTSLGTHYLETENYLKAIEYSRRAVPICLEKGADIVAWAINLEAVALTKMGEYAQAIPIFEKGALYNVNLVGALGSVLCDLANCYEQIGQHDKAYTYLKKCRRIKDSIAMAEKAAKVDELLIKYDKEANERKILQLEKGRLVQESRSNRQRSVIISLFIVLLALGSIGYIRYKFYKRQIESNRIISDQEIELQSQKLETLRSRLQTRSARAIMEGQEVERRRMARDLHDGLGGLLSALRLQLDQLNKKEAKDPEVAKAIVMVQNSIDEVRNISRDAIPQALIKMGLCPAISDFLNHLKTDDGPSIDFQHYGAMNLSDEENLQVYRIVQELVNNAIKHSQASEIMVLLVRNNDWFSITVEDDGSGYDVGNVKSGVGLKTIKHRCELLQAEFDVDSRAGSGTVCFVRFAITRDS